MIKKIVDDLTHEQLKELQRTIQLYKPSIQNKQKDEASLHYLGSFLGVNWDENGQLFMELGPYNENT